MIVTPKIHREGKWWEIEFSLGFDDDPQVTQARRLSDVKQAIIEYAAVSHTHVDVVALPSVKVGESPDLHVLGSLIAEQSSKARAEMARASYQLAQFVLDCYALSIPMRDIAYLANITVQRVSQIVRNSR